MDRYMVTGIAVGFAPGSVLALDPEQVSRRAHALSELDEATRKERKVHLREGEIAVSVERAVQFKRGETIGVVWSAGINKALLQDLAEAKSEDAERARAEEAARLGHGDRLNRERDAQVQAEEQRRARIKASGQSRQRAAGGRPAKGPAGLAGNEKPGDEAKGRSESERHGPTPEPRDG